MTALRTSAQIILRGAIHAQSEDKQICISKNKATPMITRPHLCYRQKHLKTHSAFGVFGGPRQGDIIAFKG